VLLVVLVVAVDSRTIREEFRQLIEGREVPPKCGHLQNPAKAAPANVHALITSPGGTGSSSVLKYAHSLGIKTNQLGDRDRLKHIHMPPVHNNAITDKKGNVLNYLASSFKYFGDSRKKNSCLGDTEANFGLFKSLYVFGDPVDAVISLF